MKDLTQPHAFDIRPFYVRQNAELLKIPLFLALGVFVGVVAWDAQNVWLRALSYLALGYLLMSVATFLHECTHNCLFAKEWKNWVFGIIGFLTMLVPYVSYRDDHLLHHRENRTPKDTAAFTMGKRRPIDFLLFYWYVFTGVPLLIVNFLVIHPLKYLRGWKFWLHWGEVLFHAVVYYWLYRWAVANGVVGKLVAITFWPIAVFGWLNSMRFIAEHYGTPWEKGQIAGTRTVISNPVNSWFWNNINYHIGHHIYPAVPWYHLKELHEVMLPRIQKEGGIIDRSYIVVFLRALIGGPETPERANREWNYSQSAPNLTPAHV